MCLLPIILTWLHCLQLPSHSHYKFSSHCQQSAYWSLLQRKNQYVLDCALLLRFAERIIIIIAFSLSLSISFSCCFIRSSCGSNGINFLVGGAGACFCMCQGASCSFNLLCNETFVLQVHLCAQQMLSSLNQPGCDLNVCLSTHGLGCNTFSVSTPAYTCYRASLTSA